MTIILGIDPGSRKTGFGIIQTVPRLSYIGSGVIRLPDAPLAERLCIIADSIADIIRNYQPQQAAIEEVFMARNAASALKLGQARGAAIVACAQAGLVISEYSARRIKQSMVGTGAAAKEQVQHMVCRLLALPATPQEDAADALACALCHAHTQTSLLSMGVATAALSGRSRRGRLSG